MSNENDSQRGLYRKYEVNRLNDTAGKHHDCTYFVLDEVHDKFARPALLAYADACESEFPQLAADLRARWGNPPASVLMPDVAHALATLWGCLRSGNVDGGGIALRLIEAELRSKTSAAVTTPSGLQSKLEAITQAAVGALGYLPVNVPGARMAKERIEAVLAEIGVAAVEPEPAVDASTACRNALRYCTAHDHLWNAIATECLRCGAKRVTEPVTEPRALRFVAPDQLPVGAKVRVIELGDDCNPQVNVGDVLTVVSIGFDDDHLEIFKGDEIHTDDGGADCYFANKGIGTWVRAVELVSDPPATSGGGEAT